MSRTGPFSLGFGHPPLPSILLFSGLSSGLCFSGLCHCISHPADLLSGLWASAETSVHLGERCDAEEAGLCTPDSNTSIKSYGYKDVAWPSKRLSICQHVSGLQISSKKRHLHRRLPLALGVSPRCPGLSKSQLFVLANHSTELVSLTKSHHLSSLQKQNPIKGKDPTLAGG